MPDPAPKNRDPRKMVVALQFWEGDKERAMHLARLIAEIEPVRNEQVDIAFVARFDAKHDKDTVAKVAEKFGVHELTGRRRGIGWPHGCNELALDLLQQSAERAKPGGPWENYKALYLIESDVLPMCKNWLARISDEWDVAQERGKCIMGSWSAFHSPVGHLNGNLIAAPDLAIRLKGLERVPPRAGWDAYFGPKFSPHWYKSVTMANHYDYRSNIPPEILFSCVDGVTPVAVIHGVKDKSAELQAREVGLI